MTFKKSFFGYNCDQVNNYIEETNAENSRRILVLKEKIDEAVKLTETLNCENENLKKELDGFKKKCDEIELLSQKIGLMYLVTSANTKCINDMAKENVKISNKQVDENLECIEETHKKFDELKQMVKEATDEFKEKINSVNVSLEIAKNGINDNRAVIEAKAEEINAVEQNNYAKV